MSICWIQKSTDINLLYDKGFFGNTENVTWQTLKTNKLLYVCFILLCMAYSREVYWYVFDTYLSALFQMPHK